MMMRVSHTHDVIGNWALLIVTVFRFLCFVVVVVVVVVVAASFVAVSV